MKNSFDFQKEKEQFDLSLTEGHSARRNGPDRKRKRVDLSWYSIGRFGELGFSVALPIVGGTLLGRFIDDRFDFHPKATLFFLFFGVTIGIYIIYKSVKDFLDSD